VEQDGTDIRKELLIKRSTPLIGWVGRFVNVKGCFDFLEACKLVVKEFPDARFLMAGDGYLKNEIEGRIRENLMEDKIFLLGYREDVPAIMRGIDLFVLTSHNEGLGMVLIEAMASGRPIVATDVGGVSDVVLDGVTGILVPSEEPDKIAAGIKKVLSSPELSERFGAAAKERAQLFDIENTVKETINLYKEISKNDD